MAFLCSKHDRTAEAAEAAHERHDLESLTITVEPDALCHSVDAKVLRRTLARTTRGGYVDGVHRDRIARLGQRSGSRQNGLVRRQTDESR